VCIHETHIPKIYFSVFLPSDYVLRASPFIVLLIIGEVFLQFKISYVSFLDRLQGPRVLTGINI
jgi:hypothetical protein